MRPESGFQIAPNWREIGKITMTLQYDKNVTITRQDVIVRFFDVLLFLLSSLVTDPSFISILLVVLESWQFSFIRDWAETRKFKIPSSEFCPTSGDWAKLGLPNLARKCLIKCYCKLQNARITAFTVSELLRKNQQGGGGDKITTPLPPTEIRFKNKNL